jgi:hypothetical protein
MRGKGAWVIQFPGDLASGIRCSVVSPRRLDRRVRRHSLPPMGPNRRARLLCALDDKPCTVFKCSPTEDPQVCLSGNHRPQRRPTGKNPLWRPKNAVKLIFRLLVERRRPQVAFPHGTAQEREQAAARAAEAAKPRPSARRQRIPSIGWEPKFRLVHFSLWKIRLVMWRKAHGPASHPVASFHLCDRPVSRFLRFNCGCAQLAWLALDEGAK